MAAPIPESVSIACLVNYLAVGVQIYAEQQWGQIISLVFATFEGHFHKLFATETIWTYLFSKACSL